MLNSISKIIAKAIFGMIIILLVVESALIIPAYFSVVFNTHAIASKGARANYITEDDIDNIEKNITLNNTNERFDSITVTTTVYDVTSNGNTSYSDGESYGHTLTDLQTLQRGDTYLLTVEAEYYLLTPSIFGLENKGSDDRRLSVPITITYEVPIICLKFIKELS